MQVVDGPHRPALPGTGRSCRPAPFGPRWCRWPAILLVLAALTAGCADGDDVSGLWQTPVEVAAVSAGPLSADVPVRFRLAAGQYGKDVAGVLLLYSDELFHTVEACRYLESAEFRDGHLMFSVLGEGDDSLAVDLILGDREGEEALEGTIVGQEKPVPVVLVRTGDGGDIHVEGFDLGCPEP